MEQFWAPLIIALACLVVGIGLTAAGYGEFWAYAGVVLTALIALARGEEWI